MIVEPTWGQIIAWGLSTGTTAFLMLLFVLRITPHDNSPRPAPSIYKVKMRRLRLKPRPFKREEATRSDLAWFYEEEHPDL